MRLVSYVHGTELARQRRLGVLLDGDVIADVRAGAARYLAEEEKDLQAEAIAALRVPVECAALLAAGPHAMGLVERTVAWLKALAASDKAATGLGGEALFMARAEARLFAPLSPTKIIACGRNYGKHLQEMSG
ncbi:MAG: hypothetical protein RLZ98_3710, partial [Pseudomonadota bacterium]